MLGIAKKIYSSKECTTNFPKIFKGRNNKPSGANNKVELKCVP